MIISIFISKNYFAVHFHAAIADYHLPAFAESNIQQSTDFAATAAARFQCHRSIGPAESRSRFKTMTDSVFAQFAVRGRHVQRHRHTQFGKTCRSGTNTSFQFLCGNDCFNDSRGAHSMAEIRLEALGRNILQSGKRCCLRFHFIIVSRGGAMHLQHIQLLRKHPCLIHGPAHCEIQSVTGSGRA